MDRCRWTRALVACALAIEMASASRAAAQPSGVDTSGFDRAVRPQDDFYRHVNGRWLAREAIPPYMAAWSRSNALQLRLYEDVRAILERLTAARPPHVAGDAAGDDDARRLADVYASYMNERAVDSAGLGPLRGELARIRAVRDRGDVAAALGRFARLGVDAPLVVHVRPDDRGVARYLADLQQSGLSLSRATYLSDAPRDVQVRADYRAHVARVLALAGGRTSEADAAAVLALETALAGAQWPAADQRDPAKSTNRVPARRLVATAPGFDWARYLAEAGLTGRVDSLNVGQPSYAARLGELTASTPARAWRAYLEYHLLDELSRYLPAAFGREAAAYAATVYGVTASRPRWLRAVGFVEDYLGDAIGRLWVAEHFPEAARTQAERVVRDVVAAFDARLQSVEWMSEPTRREARAKLAAIRIKFGHPTRWRRYDGLRTSPHDLAGNVLRVRGHAYGRSLERLGMPIDRAAWEMTPETVNGYYSAWRNEVVLPAALMQPPYFQAGADDAANYGALGWFVAHELSHAFDRRGSEYDGSGVQRDWWVPADRAEFAARARALAAQYGRYELAPGVPLDGELTVGENIADNGGLAVAYDAYRRALGGRAAPALDGLTGDQRFYAAFATIWAAKARDADAVGRARSDTHAPPSLRVNGALANHDPFYAAFGVRQGDRLYVTPDLRVRVWD